MIVEDDPLIAFDIEDVVLSAGCEIVGAVHTLSDAFTVLDEGHCTGVILDANLGGETAEPLVEKLKADGIPFVVVSGYSQEQLGFIDANTPLLAKPFSLVALKEMVRKHFLRAS